MRSLEKGCIERISVEQKLLEHQQEVAQGFQEHASQNATARQLQGKHEVLQLDFLANPRTPLTNISDSVYKRILGTYGYIFTSTPNLLWSTSYVYDETKGGKGANEVISMLHK